MKVRYLSFLLGLAFVAGCASVRPRLVPPYPIDLGPGLEAKLQAYGRTMDDVHAWAESKGISAETLEESRYVFASYMLGADRPIDAARCEPSIVGFKASEAIDGAFTVTFRVRSGEQDLPLNAADPVYLSSLIRCSSTLLFRDRLVPKVYLETMGDTVSASLKFPEDRPSAFFRVTIDPD